MEETTSSIGGSHQETQVDEMGLPIPHWTPAKENKALNRLITLQKKPTKIKMVADTRRLPPHCVEQFKLFSEQTCHLGEKEAKRPDERQGKSPDKESVL